MDFPLHTLPRGTVRGALRVTHARSGGRQFCDMRPYEVMIILDPAPR